MQRTFVTVLALSSALAVNASPYKLPALRRTVANVPGWETLGCYTEASNMRALSQKSSRDESMTVEMCATSCEGFTYFGVEYGVECYCGNKLHAGSVSADIKECHFKCPGDSTQTCGAGNRLNVYQASSVSPPSGPDPTYTSEGCYSEISSGRALSGKEYYDDAMTVDKCAQQCSDFTFFGLEYGRECFCGNALDTRSKEKDMDECYFSCPGLRTETCGAGNRLNLYRNGNPSVSSSASSSTQAATSSSYTSTTASSTTTSEAETTTSSESISTSTTATSAESTTSATSSESISASTTTTSAESSSSTTSSQAETTTTTSSEAISSSTTSVESSSTTTSSTTSEITTSSSTSSAASSTITSATKHMVCNRDNCLRALVAKPSIGLEFCSQYTATFNTATTSLPALVAGCQYLPSRISSACDCLAKATPAPTPSATSRSIEVVTTIV